MIHHRPRADAHIHLFRGGFAGDGRDEVSWYEELRRGAGVGNALVVGYEGEPRYAGNNAHILALSRRLGWVRPAAYVDVARPPSADRLRRLRSSGFVGWCAYLPEHGPTLSGWSADRLSALGGGILSINASPTALARAADTIAALHDTIVLVSHVGLPGPDARDADPDTVAALLAPLLALADRPHVSVKLSGLYAIDPHFPHAGARAAVARVQDAFGADRLAWASDFAPVTTAVDSADVLRVPTWLLQGVSRDEAQAMLGGTLLRHLAQVDEIGGAL